MNDFTREEFLLARVGSIGASDVPDLVRKTDSGAVSATRKNLLAKKALERLTGKPTLGYVSKAMQDGLDREADAKREYEFITGNVLVPVPPPGIIPHPTIVGAHASPDSTIGEDGLYEGKAPEPAQHLAMIRTKSASADYLTQMQWQMACCPLRVWCDFVSYQPDFPVQMRLFIQRVQRDEARIAELETAVRAAVKEIDETVEKLKREFA